MSIIDGAFAIFLFVFVGGFLLPIPHDAVVLLAGYYASASGTDPAAAVIASAIAVLAADLLLYAVSRLGGRLFRRLSTRLPKSTVDAFAERFRARAGLTIFLTRFVMGARMAAPVVSGSTRYPWHKFLFFDAAAVVLYVPLFFFAGYFFHSRVAAIVSDLTAIEHAVIVAAIAACAVAFAAYAGSRRLRKTKKAPFRGRAARHSNIAR